MESATNNRQLATRPYGAKWASVVLKPTDAHAVVITGVNTDAGTAPAITYGNLTIDVPDTATLERVRPAALLAIADPR